MPDRLAVVKALRASGVECFTRSEWGSPQERAGSYDRRASSHPMPPGPALFHFLHITVTADTDTVQEGASGARQVETYGLSTPAMVSYQDLVTNEGKYFQGQDYGNKGTHTINDKNVSGFANDLNLLGYACAIMQNVGDEVSDEQVRLVAMVFAARELAGWVRRGAPIHPHRTFAWKSCPGDKAVARLDDIKRLRDQYVRDGLPNQQTGLIMDNEVKAAFKALTEQVTALDEKVSTLRAKEAQRFVKTIKEQRAQGKSLDEIVAALEASDA